MADSNTRSEEKLSTSNSEPNSELEAQLKEYAPISSPRDTNGVDSQSRRPTSTQSLHRSRSNNGYGCDEPEDGADAAVNNMGDGRQSEKDPFEVGWEGGESDPMNPRSMSNARKWLIVLIVSASSLCV
jgi:hypothetical protein